MIKLVNITKEYSGKPVVNQISLNVQKGELCVLIGPSGCGKTTTLKMINRMIEANNGDIYIQDKNVKKYRPEILRRNIGYVIQSIGLFPHMSVKENISVVPNLLKWDKRRIEKRVYEILDLLHLDPGQYIHKYPFELSGGQAQRIGIARALASNPEILLMDEPFGALDPITREQLQKELVKLQTELNKTIVFVTHDIDEAIRLADKVAIMRDGQIIQYDTPERILSKPKNKFVINFIGTDRALKRLSRKSVNDFIHKVKPVDRKENIANIIKMFDDEKRFFWVVDDDNQLLAWIDKDDIDDYDDNTTVEDMMTRIASDEYCLTGEDTLKRAISLMVNQGIVQVPVVDSDGKILGEIRIRDILNL
jgi:osmoprotectant transport system ATP-binding protein